VITGQKKGQELGPVPSNRGFDQPFPFPFSLFPFPLPLNGWQGDVGTTWGVILQPIGHPVMVVQHGVMVLVAHRADVAPHITVTIRRKLAEVVAGITVMVGHLPKVVAVVVVVFELPQMSAVITEVVAVVPAIVAVLPWIAVAPRAVITVAVAQVAVQVFAIARQPALVVADFPAVFAEVPVASA